MNIELKDFHFSFQKHTIFHNLNLKISDGDRICIYGSNGSGKTTLLKILAKLYKDQTIDSLHNEIVSYAPSSPDSLFFHLTGEENLRLFNLLNKVSEIDHHRLLENASNTIQQALVKKSIHLSKGMKQSINLLRALHSEAKVILLDEPFYGLDQDTRDFFKDLFQNQFSSSAIIITSHGVEEGWKSFDLKDLDHA